jgi:hypothetical protein
VVAEHYKAGLSVEEHSKIIKQVSKNIGWRVGFQGKLNAIIDSAANQKTLAYSKSVAELFYENGINVNPMVDKDLFSGIQRVKQYLKVVNGKPKLYIFRTCVNLIRELKSYRWGQGETPKKIDDHALDELRYYLMSKPQGRPPKKEKTEIQKDKERLFRQILNERKNQ